MVSAYSALDDLRLILKKEFGCNICYNTDIYGIAVICAPDFISQIVDFNQEPCKEDCLIGHLAPAQS